MMYILHADWLVVCNDDFTILKDGAIAFDETIKDVGTITDFKVKYKDVPIEYLGNNSVIMPGLINSHVHLEFSANTTTLKYGSFVKWLYSVILNRDNLISNITEEFLDKKLQEMLRGGITTIGAISSYGYDIDSCIKTPQNVVYFTEVLGSKANMIDTLFGDFKSKLKLAIQYESDNFIPAIAIHSPYSTHPFLIREILKMAKDGNLAVSAHFMESKAENDWLNYSKGEFEPFFNDILSQNRSLTTPADFLHQFEGVKNLSFTHCTYANQMELKQINKLEGSIIHCPVSNRLLTNSSLNLDYIDDINLSIGTDGLSSNNSLSIFDELRAALFIHKEEDIDTLSQRLLIAATKGGGKALGLKKGILRKGYDGDIIAFKLPDNSDMENLATNIILHTHNVDYVFIRGKNEFSI